MTNAPERKSIKVKIFGSEYPLRGESEEFTRKVAQHVDDMINSIHKKLPEQPTLTVAVLSALNITEEYLKEQEGTKSHASQVEAELAKITGFLGDCSEEIPQS